MERNETGKYNMVEYVCWVAAVLTYWLAGVMISAHQCKRHLYFYGRSCGVDQRQWYQLWSFVAGLVWPLYLPFAVFCWVMRPMKSND